jgi:AcrR family transcriptional regulator
MVRNAATSAPSRHAVIDHRKKPRKRGQALLTAIFEATLTELGEAGYASLTMEHIAARARTSKASLYRRWSSRRELVADATRWAVSDRIELPDTGDVRKDLLTLLRIVARQLAGPLGEAARGLMVEALNDRELGHIAISHVNGPQLVLDILRRGAERGQVRPEALTTPVASVGPALVRHHFLIHGAPIRDKVLRDIVDQVIMPLVAFDHPATMRRRNGEHHAGRPAPGGRGAKPN